MECDAMNCARFAILYDVCSGCSGVNGKGKLQSVLHRRIRCCNADDEARRPQVPIDTIWTIGGFP